MIKQLTVFLENKKGHLAAATKAIADAGINMHALNIAESTDFGVLRIICDTPDKAAEALNNAGFRATCTPILAVRVAGEKGGLAALLDKLDQLDVNIEYGYCFSSKDDYAIDIIKVSDSSVEVTIKAAGIDVLNEQDVYAV